MNTRLAAALLAGGILAAGGYVLLDGEDAKTYSALAISRCDKALADDKSAVVTCQDGEVVTRIKWSGAIPTGYELMSQPEEIEKEDLDAAVPLALPSTCIAGMVSRDVSEHADGSSWRTWKEHHVCCGDRCRCDDPPCAAVSPVEMAGRETWRARLYETRPELEPESIEKEE